MSALFALVLLLGSVVCIDSRPVISKDRAKKSFNNLVQFWEEYSIIKDQLGVGDISVDCALCGIVVNEIAGFLIENRTEAEIEDYLKNHVCSYLGGVEQICNLLVDGLPLILSGFENQWSVSVVCVSLTLCKTPIPTHQDPRVIPKYIINLDKAPENRWDELCSTPIFQQSGQYLYGVVKQILPDGGATLGELGQTINDFYFPDEYAREIRGCAAKMGVPYGWLALYNLGYEVSDACTSIVSQTPDGKILHARNLDFWAGMGFTDTLKDLAVQIDFQKGGKTLFTSTSFVGMVGLLSGFKAGAFSATVDTRFYPDGIGELFYEIIAAIEEKGSSLVSFLMRDVFTNQNDFQSALLHLSNDELVADVYYILAGVSAGQGAVISRNRTGADDVWMLDSPKRWYEVETNYDHWKQAPWFDDRIDPANDAMNAVGQSQVSLDKMYSVLNTKPVLNLQTTYTILACPATGEYTSYTRYCPYPCVE